jgi:NAD-dependent deacetylase
MAKAHGAFVVELNLEATPNSEIVDVALTGRAKDLIPELLAPH